MIGTGGEPDVPIEAIDAPESHATGVRQDVATGAVDVPESHASGVPADAAAAGTARAAPFPASAFEQTMLSMRRSFADSPLDAASFERPLSRCDVRDCLGQCCTEGTSLATEEVHVLRELAERERGFFESHGIENPASLIQLSGRADAGGRTLVRDRLIGEVAGDYPERFGHAACAFLVDGGRCAFQVLSAERGESPWRFKPIRCWMHPLSLADHVVAVVDAPPASAAQHERSQVTRCSRTHPKGVPARELLNEELLWLGAILNRDLIAELDAANAAGGRSVEPRESLSVVED